MGPRGHLVVSGKGWNSVPNLGEANGSARLFDLLSSTTGKFAALPVRLPCADQPVCVQSSARPCSSLQEALPVSMATATDPAASQIANMVANALFEVSGCLDKLGKAILSTTEGGQLSKGTVEPKRATRTKAGKKARKQNKDGQPRRTRKPSTYNLFMKKTMQELKESGFSSPESNGKASRLSCLALHLRTLPSTSCGRQ